MNKKLNKLVFSCISFIFLFIFMNNVNAYTTGTLTNGTDKLTLTGASSSNYTFYNKKIDGNVAYCLELNRQVPHGSESKVYNLRTDLWNIRGRNALLAAQIIKAGREYPGNIYDTNRYLWIQEALNCEFKLDGSYTSNGVCNDGMVKDIIAIGEANYNQLKFNENSNSASLPKVQFNSSNRQLDQKDNGVYLSKEITLTGLVNSYGGSGYETSKVSYNITVSSSTGDAYICNSSTTNSNSCSKDKYNVPSGTSGTIKFYVLVKNGGNDGGTINISVTGSNGSTYPTAYYWVSTVSSRQDLLTYSGDGATINRSVEGSYSLTYNKTDRYSAMLEKVDNSGVALTGSNLTLFTADDIEGKTGTKTICTISGDESTCSNNSLLSDGSDGFGYSNGRYLCYEETKAPNGFKKINNVSCVAINLTSGESVYLKNNDGSASTEITEEEYNHYTSNTYYCDVKESNIDEDYINSVIANGLDNNDKITTGSCDDEANSEFNFDFKSTICIDEEGNYDSSLDSCKSDDENPGTGSNYCVGSNVEVRLESSSCDDVEYNYETPVCVYIGENSEVTKIDDNYCQNGVNAGNSFSKFTPSSGSYILTVNNSPNSVKISKTDIVGSKEIPGATLAIYTTDNNGSCTDKLATSLKFSYEEKARSVDNSSQANSEDSQNVSDNTESSNTSEDVDYGNEKRIDDADVSSNPANDGLKWVSSDSPAIISGLNAGTYCLTEELAPKGYKKASSTTKFKIDEEGNVELVDDGNKSSEYDSDSNTLSVHDDLIEISISKQDIVTGKELPGATISICQSAKNKDGDYELVTDYAGDCSTVILEDGTAATWVSTTDPHKVQGLGAGTYYLVEKIAPDGYQEAESILFTVDGDGNVFDASGKPIKDSKIVMKDRPSENVDTGDILLAIFSIIIIFAIGSVVYHDNKKVTARV